MATLNKVYNIGWYGDTGGCVDFDLDPSLAGRNAIEAVYRVVTDQANSGYETYSAAQFNANPASSSNAFQTLECGHAYIIVLVNGLTIDIPEFIVSTSDNTSGGVITPPSPTSTPTPTPTPTLTPASTGLPDVSAAAATAITHVGATLNGNLDDAGGGTGTEVIFYWGTTDGGESTAVPGDWDSGLTLGLLPAGPFSLGVGCAASTTYFYKFRAVNAIGTVWAATQSFTTAAVPVPSQTPTPTVTPTETPAPSQTPTPTPTPTPTQTSAPAGLGNTFTLTGSGLPHGDNGFTIENAMDQGTGAQMSGWEAEWATLDSGMSAQTWIMQLSHSGTQYIIMVSAQRPLVDNRFRMKHTASGQVYEGTMSMPVGSGINLMT